MRHVVAAIQVRVVGQAFPADGGAWLFNIGPHHQQHILAHFAGQGGQVAGVFEGGLRVVDGAGADDDQ